MTKQVINIGVEGNDASGDSIRDAFKKANENFTELYAIFGQGGAIGFTALSDTPDTLGQNKVPVTDSAGSAILMKDIVGGAGIVIDNTSTTQLKITNTGSSVAQDLSPTLGGHLTGAGLYGIGKIAPVSDATATALGNLHATAVTIHDLVIDKKFADQEYYVKGEAIRVRDEPSTGSGYTLTIGSFVNGNLITVSHGFDNSVNGTPFRYNSTGADATNLTSGFTYFIRFINNTTLSIHSTEVGAKNNTAKINANDGISGIPTGTHTITDAEYDTALTGQFLDSEALPRKVITRRDGDTMTGALNLHDHPGDLAGKGTPNSADDLQAATKFYVDNSTFSSTVDLFVSTQGDDAQTLTPAGQEGRSINYAYKTINKAAEKAQEIMFAAPKEPGAYTQTITFNDGANKSTVTSGTIVSANPLAAPAVALLTPNKNFVQKETIGFLNATYPELVYNQARCKLDLGLIIEGMLLDIQNDQNANFHAIQSGVRYFSTVSGQIARTTQRTQTLAALNHAESVIKTHILTNTPVTASSTYQNRFGVRQKDHSSTTISINAGANSYVHTYVSGGTVEFNSVTHNITDAVYDNVQGYVKITTATPHGASPGDIVRVQNITWNCSLGQKVYPEVVSQTIDNSQSVDGTVISAFGNKFTVIENIIQNGYSSIPTLVEGSTYKLKFTSGATAVDQGKLNNVDILPGKMIRGKTSGALGRIVKYTRQDTAGNDAVEVVLEEPQVFSVGEELEYGNFTKTTQITIHVETGQYYEDYPIKLPANCSIKGSDFRRTIIRPLKRVSQSPWRTTYFYRDYEFDGLELIPTGNPNAINLLSANKEYVKDEAVAYVDAQIATNAGIWAGFNYEKANYERDVGRLMDALQLDVKYGGNASVTKRSTSYWVGTTSTLAGPPNEQQQFAAMIDYVKILLKDYILTNTAFSSLQSVTTQQIDSTAAEAGVTTSVNTLLTNHSAVILNGLAQLDPLNDPRYGFHYLTDPSNSSSTAKNNTEMDVFMMNDANRIMNVSIQGHGGFAQVLDPEGQILIKSPYVQVASSFSASKNKKAFRGGMYIDAFVANLPATVVSKTDAFTLNISSSSGTGLFLRKPETPAPFYIDGVRYQIDAVINYNGPAGTATLLLNPTSNSGNGFVLPNNTDIVIQTAGNRSMLANDYTQVNDLGYGIVVNNGALSEQVSTFTYYNHVAYYVNNGSSIRSLNGSNSNGDFGLVSAGSDPNELVDEITLVKNMVQTARIYDDGSSFVNAINKNKVYVYDYTDIPLNVSELEIDHGGSIGIVRYEVNSIQSTTAPGQSATNASKSGTVLQLNIGGSDGLQAALSNGDKVTIRALQNFQFADLIDDVPIRPSTAIVFDENEQFTYRSIAFGKTDSLGNQVASGNSIITFDASFDYVRMIVANTEAALTTYSGAGGASQGAAAGDDVIAISKISEQTDIDRLNNGDMIFAHAGKLHRINNYIDRGTYATISISDVTDGDVSGTGQTGLAASVVQTSAITLRAGLAANENATLTVSISTCRATGHDFNQIGTGGFNTSNYPSVIYGDPQSPVQANEVDERGKGRVFYVSTDQNGFFRVGRFFTVDQGTGQVTFAASIALSNLDGIGFKRGVVITEFSSDSSMTDEASDSVPTEEAVVGYVNARLGFDKNGAAVSPLIGPGALALDGTTSPTATISFGSQRLSNLSDPSVPSDAANKSYVDARTPFGNSLMYGTGTNGTRDANDIIVWTGTEWDTATPTGTVGFTYDASNKTVAMDITDGSIENADVNTNAQISQSKLAMQAAGTRANATGISQANLGLASFDSATFTSTSGWIEIDAGGLKLDRIKNIADNHLLGRNDGDSSALGPITAIPFSTIVNTGGAFTTTGQADRIVKTHTDGSIDGQIIRVDGFPTIDTSSSTVNFKTPGTGTFMSAIGSTDATTTVSFPGSIDMGSVGVTESYFQANSGYNNTSRIATPWVLTNFIEAQSEKDQQGTGIGLGANTGYSNADEVALVSGGTTVAKAVTTGFNPGGHQTHTLGTSGTGEWLSVHAVTFSGQASTALYADLAENYKADTEYEPGTVLIFGGEQEVTTTQLKDDTRVAGVVSENPGYLMNKGLEGDNVVALALQGRVPVKVVGIVKKGDLLVAASTRGYAISNNQAGVGTVIGKAISTKDDAGKGVVEAVVGRV